MGREKEYYGCNVRTREKSRSCTLHVVLAFS